MCLTASNGARTSNCTLTPLFFINIVMVDTDMYAVVMKRLHGYETNTWRKRKRDKIIKNCIDNKHVNKQIVKKGGDPCHRHL